jgi:hypothetical protein
MPPAQSVLETFGLFKERPLSTAARSETLYDATFMRLVEDKEFDYDGTTVLSDTTISYASPGNNIVDLP